ncbi:hypothetical protein OESDEN_24127, partial [Oesophagostomum dentatum]
PAHARCVVALLDAELKYQKWNAKFGNAKRLNKFLRRRRPKVKASRQENRKLDKQTSPKPRIFKKLGKKPIRKITSSLTAFEEMEEFPKEQMRGLPPKEYIPVDDGWVGAFRMRAKRSITEQKAKPKRMKVKPIQKRNYNLMQRSFILQ